MRGADIADIFGMLGVEIASLDPALLHTQPY